MKKINDEIIICADKLCKYCHSTFIDPKWEFCPECGMPLKRKFPKREDTIEEKLAKAKKRKEKGD